MLQAVTKEGKQIIIAKLTKLEIAEKRKKGGFFCPTCKEAVMIKAGPLVIPHFAHFSQADCQANKSGEGPYHAKGKLLLYEWLLSQGLEAELEVYLKEIKQRPDILLTVNNKRIAIEFQCARAPIEQIQARMRAYECAGIKQIWILGGNRFKRSSTYHLKIDQFLIQFIHKFNIYHPQTLYFFCPDNFKLITYSDIYLAKQNKAFGKLNFDHLADLKFTDLFKTNFFTETMLYEIWAKEKEQFRLSIRPAKYGKEYAFRQFLYLKQMHLEYLPSYIYLPISAQNLMKTAIWDWQARLCLGFLEPLQIGHVFTLQTCLFKLRNFLYPQAYFTLIKQSEHPILAYLYLLKRLGILEQVSKEIFKKCTNIIQHPNIEVALKMDVETHNQLLAGEDVYSKSGKGKQ